MADRPLPTGTVTFMFTDIEGSTRMFREMGDDYRRLLERHHSLMRAAIDEFGGVEVNTEGDSFFAAFAESSGALGAALGAQRRLRSLPELRVRIGIHSGPATPSGRDYVALAVHEAARVMSAAHGGQVVVSDSAARLAAGNLPSGAALRDLGQYQLKDLAAPIELLQLTHADLRDEFPPLRTLDKRRHNLPALSTTFVGRGSALAGLDKMMLLNRLVTIVGFGGAGKTRLALRLAETKLDEQADGTWFVDLATVTEAAGVDAAIVAATGASRGIDPYQHLRNRQCLMVLDNCEHVLQAAAAAAARLLAECPGVRIVATSRELLGIEAENAWRIAPLDLETEAMPLFLDRARSVAPDLNLDSGNQEDVRRVCERLDGLPLAIELAAARMRTLSAAEINDRMNDRFRLLRGGDRTRAARQQTLAAAVEWSYDLLTESEQSFLRQMAVFVGGFDLMAAQGVGGDEVDALDAITSLTDKSLVTAVRSDRSTRYRLMETIREFGLALLKAKGEEGMARARHLDHFADMAEKAAEKMRTKSEAHAAATLALDRENLVAALRNAIATGDRPAAERLAGSLAIWAYYEHDIRLWGELQAALRMPGDSDALYRARLLAWAAFRAAHLRYDRPAGLVEAWASEAIDLSRARPPGTPPPWFEAIAECALGREMRGEESLATLEQAVATARASGDPYTIGLVLTLYAERLIDISRHEEADHRLQEALRPPFTDVPSVHARSLMGLSRAALHKGDLERARDLAGAAFDVAWSATGAPAFTLVDACDCIHLSVMATGRDEGMVDRLRAFRSYTERKGLPYMHVRADVFLGSALAACGDSDDARHVFATAERYQADREEVDWRALFLALSLGLELDFGNVGAAQEAARALRLVVSGIRDGVIRAQSQLFLGRVELSRGGLSAAETLAVTALTSLSTSLDRPGADADACWADAMRLLAGTASATSEPERAAMLYGAAQAVAPAVPGRIGLRAAQRVEREESEVAGVLGDVRFAELRRAGLHLDREAAGQLAARQSSAAVSS